MPELVIFTAPKPFTDPHIDLIQRNAIRSWLQFGDRVEVVLIGDEEGIAAAAEEFQVSHRGNVRKNSWGTPLVNSIFSLAREATKAPVLLYLNADIILLPGFIDIVRSIDESEDEYLLVGRRTDLDIEQPLSFDSGWDQKLELRARQHAGKTSYTAIDYFVFPREIFQEIPPFAIGRAGWDNWMIFNAQDQGWKTIDLSPSTTVIHQNHDYRHLPGGKPHYKLEESKLNVQYGGGETHIYDLLDLKWEYSDQKITRIKFDRLRLLRKLERWVMSESREGWRWRVTRWIKRARKKLS